MAEYIDRNLIEWYGCNFENADCEKRECSGCSHAECSHSQVMQIPTADVIEREEYEKLLENCKGYERLVEVEENEITELRSKIDKAIKEIIEYRNDDSNDFCEVEVGAINGALEILKRNIGE